jgi:hypothetical protein
MFHQDQHFTQVIFFHIETCIQVLINIPLKLKVKREPETVVLESVQMLLILAKVEVFYNGFQTDSVNGRNFFQFNCF